MGFEVHCLHDRRRPIPALSKPWLLAAASAMASTPLLSAVFFPKLSATLPRGEAALQAARLGLRFFRNPRTPSPLVPAPELPAERLRPDLWAVPDSLAMGAWLVSWSGARLPRAGLLGP